MTAKTKGRPPKATKRSVEASFLNPRLAKSCRHDARLEKCLVANLTSSFVHSSPVLLVRSSSEQIRVANYMCMYVSAVHRHFLIHSSSVSFASSPAYFSSLFAITARSQLVSVFNCASRGGERNNGASLLKCPLITKRIPFYHRHVFTYAYKQTFAIAT